MSPSSNSSATDFDRWLTARFAETNGFTVLILLVAIRESVEMLACSWLHVIGDETSWAEIKPMIDRSGKRWDGVAFFAETSPGGGPMLDTIAAARLQTRIDETTADRMCLNEAGFFDPLGRAIRIDPAA